MMTVFPLIMYLLRVSVLYPIFKTVWPGLGHILALNSSITAICVLFAIYLPNIGTVLRHDISFLLNIELIEKYLFDSRFSGAACGLTIIFALPILVYLASARRNGEISKLSLACHVAIILLGVANFLAQFFI